MPYTWATGDTITAARLNAVVASLVAAQNLNTWATKTSFSGTARRYLAGASLGGYAYAIGGYTGTTNYATVERYNPSLNTWATMTSIGTAKHGLAAAAVGNYIYIYGGNTNTTSSFTNTNVTQQYDSVANSWSNKANLNTARSYLAGCELGGYAYSIGGYVSANSAVVEQYDPVANTWTAKTSLGTARADLTASSDGTYAYAIGGYTTTAVATNEQYNPTANTWTTKTAMTTARNGPCSGAVSGKIYVIGGSNVSGTPIATNEEYNPTANTWASKTNMTTARTLLAAAVVSNKIYAMGGRNSTPADLQTNEVYDPLGTGAVNYTSDGNRLVAAYSPGATLTNATTGATGKILPAKLNDVISTDSDTDVIVI